MAKQTFIIPGRSTPVSEDQYKEYWTSVFRTDPVMQSLFLEAKKTGGSEKTREAKATERAKALGWEPADKDWSVDFDNDGFRTERKSFFGRHKKAIIGTGIALGTLGLGAAGIGPLAAIGGSGGSAYVGADVASTAASALGGSAATVAAPAVVAAAGKPSLWKSFITSPVGSTAIAAGTNLAGTAIQTKAAENAAEQQRLADEKALEWQQQQYGVRQRQLAPAIGAGNNATVKLNDLMGLPAIAPVDPATQPGYQAPPPAPAGAPAPAPGAAPGAQAPQYVQMKAPNGAVSVVPADQVAHYEAKGAVRVQ